MSVVVVRGTGLITPPVPAAVRVASCLGSGGLWVEDDHPVGVGPLIVASVLNVSVLDAVVILKPVKRIRRKKRLGRAFVKKQRHRDNEKEKA